MLANITFYSRFRSTTSPAPCGGCDYRLGDAMQKKPSRQRVQQLKVPVLPTEAEAIKTSAASCSLSVAAYLRTLGLKHQPKTTLDADAVIAMAKVNGDLGRLGGLLKMLLTNDERMKSLGTDEVNTLLGDIRATQTLLFEKVQSL